MFSGLKSLRDNLYKSEFQKKLCENSFAEVAKLFERYMSFLRCENGKLSELWVSKLDLVDILLAMKRASREGDWDLHLSSIRKLILWCFAYDNINYARYLSSYRSEISHHEDEHPHVFTHLKSGGFAVQLGEDNPFGKIPVDQACEETVNKDTQTPGGNKGFTLKSKAVKYYLVAEYRSIFMGILKVMLHLSKSSCHHNDLQKSRIARDEANVQSLLMTMEGWVNPFQGKTLSACPQVRWLLRIVLVIFYKPNIWVKEQSFSKERLEANPPIVRFHDSMSKAMLNRGIPSLFCL